MLERSRGQARPFQPVAVAGRRHLLTLEQPCDDFELLTVDPHSPGGQSEGGVLLVAVAEPDAEHEAPAGEDVERRRLLGDLDWVEEREQEDAGTDAEVARLGGQPAQQRHGLEHLVGSGEEVLAGEDRMEPGVAHEADLLDVLQEPYGRIRPRPGAAQRTKRPKRTDAG